MKLGERPRSRGEVWTANKRRVCPNGDVVTITVGSRMAGALDHQRRLSSPLVSHKVTFPQDGDSYGPLRLVILIPSVRKPYLHPRRICTTQIFDSHAGRDISNLPRSSQSRPWSASSVSRVTSRIRRMAARCTTSTLTLVLIMAKPIFSEIKRSG